MRHDELADILAMKSLLETCRRTSIKHDMAVMEYFLDMAAQAAEEELNQRCAVAETHPTSVGPCWSNEKDG